MITPFRALRRKLGPRWLTEGEGELVGVAIDTLKDAFVQRAFDGLMARFPQGDPTGATTAPEDALVAMGRDRRVVRGLNETSPSYAARMLTWIEDRKRAGNPFQLMKELADYTGPLCSFRTVDVRGNWYSRAVDGTKSVLLKQANWQWDTDTTGLRWSRFWVIIYPNGLWVSSGVLGAKVLGDDPTRTLGSTATAEQVATLRHLVNDWKPGGTRCVNVILALDPASFDPSAPEPDGLWAAQSKTVAGVQVPSRLATARYLDGV